MKKITTYYFKLSKYPLLKRLFMIQASLIAVGVIIILSMLATGNIIANETANKALKEKIRAMLKVKQDQWVAWKLLGLDIALNEDISATAKKWPISKIDILDSNSLNQIKKNEEVVILNDSYNKNNSPAIVAYLSSDSNMQQSPLSAKILMIFISLILLFFSILIFSQKYILNEIHNPLMALQRQFDDYKKTGKINISNIYASGEIKYFIENITMLYEQNIKLQYTTRISEIARQVAHDIRSPVSALNLTIASEIGMSEDKKNLAKKALSRINDISNNLLNQSKLSKIENVDICSVVNDIVSEKKIECPNVEIYCQHNTRNNPQFVSANESDLRCIISNLLNNSIEAKASHALKIKCRVDRFGSCITATIADNGVGIPDSNILNVGKAGWSSKANTSQSGNGLGISNAISKMNEWGGDFKIFSREGVGTIITLTWPILGKTTTSAP